MRLLRFFLQEAREIQSRDSGGGYASLTALTAVLFLLAVVLLAAVNIRGLARSFESRKGIEVFLTADVAPDRVNELASIFRSFGEVAQVDFIPRDTALDAVEEDLGGVDVVSVLGENPLCDAFRIRLTPQAASRPGVLQGLAKEIGGYEGVDEVLYGGAWIEGLERGLRYLNGATLGAGLLAAISVLLVVWNTVRLAFLGRQETIRILKIVGATPGFIRTPYLLLGALHTALAAALALLLAAAVRFAVTQVIPGIRFFPPNWIASFLAAVVLLGFIASFASVEPALRRVERQRDALTR